MTLPATLQSARMTDSTAASTIDNEVGNLEQDLADIFGFTIDVAVNAGDVRSEPFQVQMSNDVRLTWGGANNGIDGNETSDYVRLFTANTERLRVDSSGNVGIGTSTPGTTLDVSAANIGSDRNIRVNNTDNTNGASHATLVATTGGASGGDPMVFFSITGAQSWAVGVDNSDSDTFKIASEAALGAQDRLVIDTSGNVGIGTTSPSFVLHLVNATSPQLVVEDSTTPCQAVLASTDTTGQVGTITNHELRIRTNSSDRMTVTAAGLVGIGTISPGSLLHIRGTDGAPIFIVGNTTEDTRLEIDTYQDDRIELRATDTGAVARNLVISANSVGFNTSTPADIAGTALATGTNVKIKSTADARLILEGDATASLYLVDDAQPLDDKVMVLAGASGQTKFQSLTDALANRVDNILVLDQGTGTCYMGANSNADMTGNGLTIDQGTNDSQIMGFKSTGDVAHGMTAHVETSTFAGVYKVGGDGGFQVVGYGGTVVTQAIEIAGRSQTQDTTDVAASRGVINFLSQKKSGTTVTALADTENVFAVQNGTLTRLLIKGNGDLHVTNTSLVALDHYDDAQLIRAFETSRAPAAVIKSRWDDYVRYNEQDLIDAGILGDTIANGGLWNVSQHIRLLNGAIWQMYERWQDAEQRLLAVEQRLLA